MYIHYEAVLRALRGVTLLIILSSPIVEFMYFGVFEHPKYPPTSPILPQF